MDNSNREDPTMEDPNVMMNLVWMLNAIHYNIYEVRGLLWRFLDHDQFYRLAEAVVAHKEKRDFLAKEVELGGEILGELLNLADEALHTMRAIERLIEAAVEAEAKAETKAEVAVEVKAEAVVEAEVTQVPKATGGGVNGK